MQAPESSHHLKRLAAISALVGTLALPVLQAAPAAAAAPLPVGSAGGANLIFSDEFDGSTLNTATWQTCSWWATTTCSIESNNEQELYTPNNVSVANGALTLQARRENAVAWNGKTYNYTSGMVSTGGRSGSVAPGFTYKYGYAEARVDVPAGQGLWPAFWTLPADYSWPPEIDAMEILGNQPNVTHMTYHYLDANGVEQGPGASWAGPDFSAGWHTFGVDWEPNAIVWYVDGVERNRFTDASAITAKPQYLLFNLAVGGNWPGSAERHHPLPERLPGRLRPGLGPLRHPCRRPRPRRPRPATPRRSPPTARSRDWRLGDPSGTTAADSFGHQPRHVHQRRGPRRRQPAGGRRRQPGGLLRRGQRLDVGAELGRPEPDGGRHRGGLGAADRGAHGRQLRLGGHQG